jgi:hypothetical protein
VSLGFVSRVCTGGHGGARSITAGSRLHSRRCSCTEGFTEPRVLVRRGGLTREHSIIYITDKRVRVNAGGLFSLLVSARRFCLLSRDRL